MQLLFLSQICLVCEYTEAISSIIRVEYDKIMVKNEMAVKVRCRIYRTWVQGTWPQLVVTALSRWNWAPLSKQWRSS